MQVSVHTVADLGLALRAARRSGKVRLDDLAQIAGVSKQFVSDVEYGKSTVQMGLVLKLLAEIGVTMSLNISREAQEEWGRLLANGGVSAQKTRKMRVAEQAATVEPTQEKH